MQQTRFAVFLLSVYGVQGDTRKLRGPFQEPHLWPQLVEKAGFGESLRGSEPVTGQAHATQKELEAWHNDVILPLSSVKNFVQASATEVLISSTIWICFVILTAFLYKSSRQYLPETGTKPIDPFRTQEELSEWQSEWYQFYRYPEIFCWSCCCPCIRWAHTMDWLHILDYWPAFFLYFLLSAVNQFTGFIFVGICFTVMLTMYRQKMRMLFGMANYSTCFGYTTDCLGFCFCWPCFIAQEANQVAEAAKKGWTMELAAKPGGQRFDASVSASQES